MDDTKNPRERILISSLLLWSYSSNKVKRVNFIAIDSDWRKNVMVSDFLVPRALRRYITWMISQLYIYPSSCKYFESFSRDNWISPQFFQGKCMHVTSDLLRNILAIFPGHWLILLMSKFCDRFLCMRMCVASRMCDICAEDAMIMGEWACICKMSA